MSARNGARETTPDTKMNAIYTNHLTTLHNMLADVRCWSDSPRKAALIEEYEAQIEEYTAMCEMDFEMGTNENDVVLTCELEQAVGWARGEAVVAVDDARKIASQMESLAPGCGMEHGELHVWSVNVELEDGARVEIENAPLNLMRLRVSGEYGRMITRDDAMGEWLAALEGAEP